MPVFHLHPSYFRIVLYGTIIEHGTAIVKGERQYTLFSGYEKARQGKIHFAGEHCSINFQGFMEGGAEEGARAANEILTDYKNGIFP